MYHSQCNYKGDVVRKGRDTQRRSSYFAIMSTWPQWSMLFRMTWSTVFLTRTSHSRPKQFLSCHLFICSTVFSCDQPTAVHWSPCDKAARTSDRPIWPVAPNIYTIYYECRNRDLSHDYLLSMLLAVGDCARRVGRRWQEALAVGDATQLRATDFGWRFRRPWAKDSKIGRSRGLRRDS
jgi:hypothetical protein